MLIRGEEAVRPVRRHLDPGLSADDVMAPTVTTESAPGAVKQMSASTRMIVCMRTTLNLSDALFAEAKARARSEGRTFTSFLEEALREHLERDATPPEPQPLPTFTPNVPGTLVDLDDKDAVWDALDRAS